MHEGVCEYELIDVEDGAAHTLALTVVRATGMLSRLGMAYRPFPAGPMTPVEGLQMVGKAVTLRYALALDCTDPYALADDVLLPLEAVSTLGGGTRPTTGLLALRARGRGQRAATRVGEALELRVFNPSANETTGSRSRAARAGSSTCVATRTARSRTASRYAPSGSLPPGSATD